MIQARQNQGAMRVVSWNIHKGVRGMGPLRSLQIHNIAYALQSMDADLICLQEVRAQNRREALRFAHWPQARQADYLAPDGYHAIYHSNAITKHGEHGNALLSRWPVLEVRHEDMSDHRFEQRGLLHAQVQAPQGVVHVLVLHLGLMGGSRVRQLAQTRDYLLRHVPQDEALVIAGDFNCVSLAKNWALDALSHCTARHAPAPTFPSRLPLRQLDHIFARGLDAQHLHAPRGKAWLQMSDHLPLIAELQWR
jgi:endonuclease/exonuclease/phosphatase family metal-dependent hydrolase